MNLQRLQTPAALSLGISLSLGFIIAGFLIARSVKDIQAMRQTIEVKGFAEKHIRSNLVHWEGVVTARGASLAGVYEKLETNANRIISVLGANGFQRDKISFASPHLTTISKSRNSYDSEGAVIDGYKLTQSVTLDSDNIEQVVGLSQKVSALLKEGIEFQVMAPRFYYTKISDLKVEMLEAAAQDARNRAVKLAQNSGAQVGSLKSASQGVFQITAPNSEEISGYGMNDTSSIDKSVKAVVTIEYLIR